MNGRDPQLTPPSVDSLINDGAFGELLAQFGRPLVLEAIRSALAGQRKDEEGFPGAEPFAAECGRRLRQLMLPSLRPVFNLSGTVLHTNLGRALYPAAAIAAATEAMARPVNLEYDLGGAERGERDHHVESWLIRHTGAEAAVVVNNNAAAVYLALNSLALGKEVLVSRGELVEIGGSFRVPNIMARAGCKLREVGTTNRTHLADYAQAIGKRTAAIMKVHASNYAILGFTASVAEAELAALARQHDLPFVNDLGSGTLLDLERFGLAHEPTAREAISQGADIVTFSGDKLLGGPQCGLIVGRRALIARIGKNPMKRALRVDKVRLAALEAVLRLYANPDAVRRVLPTLRLLTRTQNEIAAQAGRILPAIAAALSPSVDAKVVGCASQVGSGALPVESLPSAGIALTPRGKRRSGAADRLAEALRKLPVPVIGRIRKGELILDLRCLEDEAEFVAQLGQVNYAV